MTELTKEQLEEKIEIVKKDIATADSSKKSEILTQYLEYLNDELSRLKHVDKN